MFSLMYCFYIVFQKYPSLFENVTLQFLLVVIDAHGLKIQGRGYLKFLPKSRGGGGEAFKKNCLGGPPISGFIAFLLTSVLKFSRGGYYIYPPPSPTSPPYQW
jgi:hypothetical protein